MVLVVSRVVGPFLSLASWLVSDWWESRGEYLWYVSLSLRLIQPLFKLCLSRIAHISHIPAVRISYTVSHNLPPSIRKIHLVLPPSVVPLSLLLLPKVLACGVILNMI